MATASQTPAPTTPPKDATTLPAPPSTPTTKPVPKLPVKGEEDKGGFANTGLTADELVEKYGKNPDGSPKLEETPDTPVCPVVNPSEYPFDDKAIPSGCSAPLSAECIAYYNKLYAPAK